MPLSQVQPLRIYVRESQTPLGFCNRYLGAGSAGDQGLTPPEPAIGASADVTSAFGSLSRSTSPRST
jgi:hypothetical protein